MAKYIQVVFPSFWWDSGTFDADGNPNYTIIDTSALVAFCGSAILGGVVNAPQGNSFTATSQTQTYVIQVLTNDIVALKAGINSYLATLSTPVANYPAYPFGVDVTINP